MMQFDTILKHDQTCHNAYDAIWYDSQTCLNLFRFNMIWNVTILKHVWTCSNMSKLAQIQYATNCYNSYDSQTCLNMFRINYHDMNCYDYSSQTILKHVKTCQ